MIIVPIGYTNPELYEDSEIVGGSPYGAASGNLLSVFIFFLSRRLTVFLLFSQVSGKDGSRAPSEKETNVAFNQGRYVATVAKDLKAGRIANQH